MPRSVPEGADVRNTLLFYDRIMTHHTPNTPLPFTLSAIETDLCQHETHLARTPSSTPRYQSTNSKFTKSTHPKANAASKHYKPIQCLKCKGPHKLIECKKATEEEKKTLWEAYKKTWT